ncbi:DBR1-domain-containing protein [Trichodelitschia bisporula]|uniref:DBR1-domain-containing protein n=1 Tax=Trichodelitschia bisporula TaxID=703511 RepID=A0A6G1HYQ4_9PEZI|nr:DBR1-domain-containing protein [Trichodelitschia bisporula]
MAEAQQSQALRVAVIGCGHGALKSIYSSVAKTAQLKGWDGVDLVIIGGDFQAVRNAYDLNTMSVPPKYRHLGDFHEYYSGAYTAPYLTIFVGGNHEASSYLSELFYGGWVAPNIYYMGAANVVRLGSLRIAGLSGIWKGFDYRKTHYERLPYNESDVKGIYHVRQFDTCKLLQIQTQIDIGMSHDWPRGIEWKGDHKQLFRIKSHFEQDARTGQLGSVAADLVLQRLRPAYWFSAHMHVKYAATIDFSDAVAEEANVTSNEAVKPASVAATSSKNTEEIELDLDDDAVPEEPKPAAPLQNSDEIDLDLDGDTAPAASMPTTAVQNSDEINLDLDDEPEPAVLKPTVPVQSIDYTGPTSQPTASTVPESLRAQLPASFAPKPKINQNDNHKPPQSAPGATNKTTRFLALDKLLPGRDFMQLVEITPLNPSSEPLSRPLHLQYDPEWLAITRAFAPDFVYGDRAANQFREKRAAEYEAAIAKAREWVDEHVVREDRLGVPLDFVQTAPVYDPALGPEVHEGPREYTNPHTATFCELLGIDNPFHASEEEREAKLKAGPADDNRRFRGSRGGHGWRGGRGDRGGGRGWSRGGGWRGRGN